MSPDARLRAAIAAHRFGLGQARLDDVGDDAAGWLHAQVGPADVQRGSDLADAGTALRTIVRVRQQQALRREEPASGSAVRMPDPAPRAALRELGQADLHARLATAATTGRPFAERLALFWTNHFTVSSAKASAQGLVGAFEREAVRPNVGGRFDILLTAVVHHPAMLRYLDNDQSAGPHSRVVQRLQRRPRADDEPPPRPGGLNENLAREILELHTLGVDGGYTQADVTAFARVLTGWRVPLRDFADGAPPAAAVSAFDAAWHEPGPKQVLGRRYPEGPQALDLLLRDLALHPSTAHFVATKLARHFVADQPPPALVQRLSNTYLRHDGDLAAVYAELLRAPEAWQPRQAKLRTPEEWVIATARLLAQGEALFVRVPDGGTAQLGQRLHAAPSPAGWPDQADEWLGPDALWKRVEWASRVADRAGRYTDARALADSSLGPLLGEHSRRQIERAADGPQALALLLLAPEFQRR